MKLPHSDIGFSMRRRAACIRLTAVLFACGAASLHAQVPGELISHVETISPRSDDLSRPWKLKWANTETSYNNLELFVVVHERPYGTIGEVESRAAVYLVEREGYRLLQRLAAKPGLSFFLRPVTVWARVDGSTDDREQLVQITEMYYGTGALREEHVFASRVLPRLNANNTGSLKLVPVEFISADSSYAPHLANGENVWKGVNSTFTPDGLRFEFAIWRDGDANCCPTAGRVTGAYKLERQGNEVLRISMATAQRKPVED